MRHVRQRVSILGGFVLLLMLSLVAAWAVVAQQDTHLRTLSLNRATDRVLNAAFSPDGTLLATGTDDRVTIWRVSDGQRVHTEDQFGGAGISSVAFAPDGKLLVMVSGDDVGRVVDVSTWQPRSGWEGQVRQPRVAFAPSGETVASGRADGQVEIWPTRYGPLIQTLDGRSLAGRRALAGERRSPDGQLFLELEQNTVQIVQAADGIVLRRLTHAAPGTLLAAVFAADGQTVRGWTDDNRLWEWRVGDGALVRTVDIPVPHYGLGGPTPSNAAFAPTAHTFATWSGYNANLTELWRLP